MRTSVRLVSLCSNLDHPFFQFKTTYSRPNSRRNSISMATRRSTRIVHNSEEGPSGPKDEDYHSEPDDKNDDDAPKRKKARTGGKRKAADSSGLYVHKRQRGNRGLLKDVVDMPLDVVLEVCRSMTDMRLPSHSTTPHRYLASYPRVIF